MLRTTRLGSAALLAAALVLAATDGARADGVGDAAGKACADFSGGQGRYQPGADVVSRVVTVEINTAVAPCESHTYTLAISYTTLTGTPASVVDAAPQFLPTGVKWVVAMPADAGLTLQTTVTSAKGKKTVDDTGAALEFEVAPGSSPGGSYQG